MRISFKDHLETGCLLAGWTRWIIAGVGIFFFLLALERLMEGIIPENIAATPEGLFEEPCRIIRNLIFMAAKYGKCIVLVCCIMKSICLWREKQ